MIKSDNGLSTRIIQDFFPTRFFRDVLDYMSYSVSGEWETSLDYLILRSSVILHLQVRFPEMA